MALEVTPEPGNSELAAIGVALARTDVRPDGQPDAYTSNWRRSALREAVGNESELEPKAGLEPYALSPRSTRGATRA